MNAQRVERGTGSDERSAERAPALARGELIGLRVRVTASGDEGLVAREGVVVDESMKTFTVATSAGDRIVPKQGQVFQFTLPSGAKQSLEGRDVAFRPEDRTRKARPAAARRSNSR